MLMRDLGFNSLRLMELAFTLEDLFAMDPAAVSEAPATGTVADLSDYLAELVANADATLPSPEAVEAAVAGL
jgi:acyl carrier protein